MGVEKLGWLLVGKAGDEAVGDDFEAGVVEGGDIVVVAAGKGDPLLGVDKLFLELAESLVGGQFGIFFDDGPQGTAWRRA